MFMKYTLEYTDFLDPKMFFKNTAKCLVHYIYFLNFIYIYTIINVNVFKGCLKADNNVYSIALQLYIAQF